MMTTLRLVLIFACMIALQACNTVRGAGTDIKQGGEAIEDIGQ
jgi:predicted small secreted protein